MRPNLALEQTLSLPLDVALAEFLAEGRLRHLSPATLTWYEYGLRPFLRFAAERSEVAVEDLTPQTVRAFLTHQNGRVQARRLNHYRLCLDRFCQWLMAQGYADTNPAADIPKARETKKLIATFTPSEVQALLDQPDTRSFLGLRDYVFMLLLLDTGVRLSEALGLACDDLNLEDGTFKVLGKGAKERMVGFSPVLDRHLRRYLARRQVAFDAAGLPAGGWLFPNQLGGKWTAKGAQMRLREYAAQAGVSRVRVSPHTFRHTFALWFVRNGGSPFHLQKILGHTSLDMSRRYCELAEVDFIARQQQLSPLASGALKLDGQRYLR